MAGCRLLLLARQGGGWGRSLQRLLGAAACWLVAALLAALVLVGRAFQEFAGRTYVGRVTTILVSPWDFELTYLPAGASEARPMRLRGDQWAISGGIVKWHIWLTALGLKSYHEPLWINGQFSDPARQRAEPPTVVTLDSGHLRLWHVLYLAAPYLPFIEAAYGSSAFVYVEPGRTQEVYVTPSGYMILRALHPLRRQTSDFRPET